MNEYHTVTLEDGTQEDTVRTPIGIVKMRWYEHNDKFIFCGYTVITPKETNKK